MDNKELRVLKASKEVFLKYGYVKVTMNDIAQKAGFSRPALYLIYPGKEAIFNAVILYLATELSERVKQEISVLNTPLEKLKSVFDIWVVRMYELLNGSPEAKELYQCSYPFARESVHNSSKMFERDILEVLSCFPEDALNRSVSRQELAHIFASAVSGFKQHSENVGELMNKIELLIRIGLNTNE